MPSNNVAVAAVDLRCLQGITELPYAYTSKYTVHRSIYVRALRATANGVRESHPNEVRVPNTPKAKQFALGGRHY